MSEHHPGVVSFQKACECDRNGLEAEAIPYYRQALAAGLSLEDRRSALLGLGSSLRNVSEHEEAVKVLEGAVDEFPDYPALNCFLALAYHSAGRPKDALVTLLDISVARIDLDGYERALAGYRDELEAMDT